VLEGINLLEGKIKMFHILIQNASLPERFVARTLRCQTELVDGVTCLGGKEW